VTTQLQEINIIIIIIIIIIIVTVKATNMTFQQKYSRTILIRTLGIRIDNYTYKIGSSRKFVENSAKLTYFEITGVRINNSTALWLLELQTRRGRKV